MYIYIYIYIYTYVYIYINICIIISWGGPQAPNARPAQGRKDVPASRADLQSRQPHPLHLGPFSQSGKPGSVRSQSTGQPGQPEIGVDWSRMSYKLDFGHIHMSYFESQTPGTLRASAIGHWEWFGRPLRARQEPGHPARAFQTNGMYLGAMCLTPGKKRTWML